MTRSTVLAIAVGWAALAAGVLAFVHVGTRRRVRPALTPEQDRFDQVYVDAMSQVLDRGYADIESGGVIVRIDYRGDAP